MASAVDPVTAEVIRNGLVAAAREMSQTLVRSAFNPLLYEVKDFGLGIVSARGELWAEAPGIPLFIGSLSATIRSGLDVRETSDFADGDVYIVNDPYLTGTHISDTTVYMPIIVDAELIGFAVATAHWSDIGGKTPGGWCPDSTDVYQEGLCFTHEKLSGRNGTGEIFDFICRNVRYPSTVEGDLRAQMAACRQGVARVHAMCRKYGAEVVEASMGLVIEATERAVTREIAEIPDGVYEAGVGLDMDGVTDQRDHRVAVQVAISRASIRVSFRGTTPAARGPINLPAPGSRAAVCAALKGLLMPFDATNEGHFRAIDFQLQPGLLVSPERPDPCDSFGYVGTALVNLTVQAMTAAVPMRCPAGSFQLFGVYFFRSDPRDGDPFIFIDPNTGGHGGRPHGDGPSMIFLGDGDTPNTPIEVLESRYPLRCEAYGFDIGSAGAGQFRGGLGLVREFVMLEDGILMQTSTENAVETLAKGFAGGADGRPSVVVVEPDSDEPIELCERVSFYGPFDRGTRVRLRSGGGGGWGAPTDRATDLVRADVENGLIAHREAREVYGVVLGPGASDGAVDLEATEALRHRMGRAPDPIRQQSCAEHEGPPVRSGDRRARRHDR